MKFLKRITKTEFVFRFLDLLISIAMIIVFAPLMILIAVCIKLGDFKSKVFVENHFRVGKDGKPFHMYKFRTMVPYAHELLHSDPNFSSLKEKHDQSKNKLRIGEDIRVTRIGAFLRRLDLDELPQFFNVLKGEMSMVGPRAYFKEEIDSYTRQHREFGRKMRSVLKLKPGVTGLWQISGRNLLTVRQRLDYDYKYYKKRSILLYILILLKTPYIVFSRYGAYD